MPVYLASDSVYTAHPTGDGHPECPARLSAIHRAIDAAGLRERLLVVPTPEPVDDTPLLRCHSQAVLDAVAMGCRAATPISFLDPDTRVGPRSDMIARTAAAHVMAACDQVMAAPGSRVFCATRPPGHHAERRRAMGFCLYNHVAIAAAHLRATHGLSRILILDWDVHHGNGTQDIFYDDPDVYYVSLHQHPWYPGSGAADECGSGHGRGYTLNVPLPAGSDHDDALAAMDTIVLPAAREFQPQFILISAGFDAHHRDPLASLEWETRTYGALTDRLTKLAEHAGSHGIVSILEGGYDLTALGDSVVLHLQRLLAGME